MKLIWEVIIENLGVNGDVESQSRRFYSDSIKAMALVRLEITDAEEERMFREMREKWSTSVLFDKRGKSYRARFFRHNVNI